MNPLLEQFIQEARELFEGAGHELLELERSPADERSLNALFRAFHTAKGASGLFDLPPLTGLLHAAEDLLDAVRGRELALAPEMIDELLAALDRLGSWLDALAASERLPAEAFDVGKATALRLRRFLPEAEHAAAAAPGGAAAGRDLAWCARLPQAVRAQARELIGAGRPVTAIVYRPAAECFFNGDDPLYLMAQIDPLPGARVAVREPWPALDALDPFRCNLEFFALAAEGPAALAERFRYVADQVELCAVTADDLPAEEPASMARTLLVDLLRTQRSVLAGECGVAALPSVVNTLVGALRFNALDHEAANIAQAAQSPAELPACIERILAAMAPPPSAAPASPEPVAEAAEAVGVALRPAQRVLKIDQTKIDHLMDVTGELIVAKNVLPFLAKRAEGGEGAQRLARAIKEQYAVFNRIADELQRAIMQVRMLPVGSVFQRFPRLVRDLARKLDKEVRLVTEGEETEADKNVIELLAEPLVHLIRNALDHGIEPAAERLAQGKPAEGCLRLAARHENDHVIIEVADDGRGIDPEALRRKAVAMGLMDAERAAALPDQEAVQLVFHPGLSLAKAVSDVSGRGVGMDAVRAMVEGCGGSVQLSSERGRGARVVLSLPMSMAVSRVMMVRQHDQTFGVPVDQIIETMRVPATRVHGILTQRTVDWRGRTLPLISLARRLQLEPRPEREPLPVLVVQVRGEPLGLIVEELLEGVDILVKPLAGMLAELPVFSGSALLGDGSVLLVLNLKELI